MKMVKKMLSAALCMCMLAGLTVNASAAAPKAIGDDMIYFNGANGRISVSASSGNGAFGIAVTEKANASVKVQMDLVNLNTGATLYSSSTLTAQNEARINTVERGVHIANQSMRGYGAHQVLSNGTWYGEYTSASSM